MIVGNGGCDRHTLYPRVAQSLILIQRKDDSARLNASVHRKKCRPAFTAGLEPRRLMILKDMPVVRSHVNIEGVAEGAPPD